MTMNGNVIRERIRSGQTTAREMNRAIKEESRFFGDKLELVDNRRRGSPDVDSVLVRAWRNRGYLVQLFEDKGQLRLSINRAQVKRSGEWEDGISWDTIQELKSQAGFGGWWAVEVYPPDDELINVANMRHVWLLAEQPPYCWSK